MSDRFKYWGWGDTMSVLGLILAAALLSLAGFAICADHRIRYYYIHTPQSSIPTSCVYGYRDWMTDVIASCSPNPADNISVMRQLNDALKK